MEVILIVLITVSIGLVLVLVRRVVRALFDWPELGD